MRRRLVPFVSALSLLLFAVVCVTWAATYREVGILYYTADERDGTWQHRFRVGVRSERGGCAFSWERIRTPEAGARQLEQKLLAKAWDGRRAGLSYGFISPATQYPLYPTGTRSAWNAAGFQLKVDAVDQPFRRLRSRIVVAPHWCLALATVALPAVRSYRRRRRDRRAARGLCPACGYDLRATPDRCPECGGGAAAAPKGAPA